MNKVNVNQFYGIEIEEFTAQIAQVALWLVDHQMNLLVQERLGTYFARIQLTASASIHHANALAIDWESVIKRTELSYILGNPLFLGARVMSKEQKAEVNVVFDGMKDNGNLDYVTCWYKKAAQYIQGTEIEVAFVSTNSICEGERVAVLWPEFRETKKIYQYVTVTSEPVETLAKRVNVYLIDGYNVFISSRTKPICKVPEIGIGNKPIDNGNYLFTESGKNDFLTKGPKAEKWFKKWIGSDEFINGYFRYCLWLGDYPPDELRKMPECIKRVEAIKQFRLKSSSEGTRKLVETPCRFHVENMPDNDYIVIPKVSSEKRKYIPMNFMSPNVIASDLVFVMPNATMYHFGILTSTIHMAWTRSVCGRLEMRYRYSKDIVYNNFPWPNPTEKQKETIEKAAQDVLDTRAKFPSASLADLYDPVAMPPVLVKAHQKLDKAVEAAYGRAFEDDSQRVAFLFELYQNMSGDLLVEGKKRRKG
jgi:hypothetical protein